MLKFDSSGLWNHEIPILMETVVIIVPFRTLHFCVYSKLKNAKIRFTNQRTANYYSVNDARRLTAVNTISVLRKGYVGHQTQKAVEKISWLNQSKMETWEAEELQWQAVLHK